MAMIGAILLGAAAGGTLASVYNKSADKLITCSENTISNGTTCVPCLGGSSSTGSGVQANIKGCYCPKNMGWDPTTNSCRLCPVGQNTYGEGGQGLIQGCKCEYDTDYYDTETNLCTDCGGLFVGTEAKDIVSDGWGTVIPTNKPKCYCRPGSSWNSTTSMCDRCPNSTPGFKDGKCMACPDNATSYNWIGDKTANKCYCNNGYYNDNNICKACPAGQTSKYGQCCPSGSSKYGSGAKVSEGCYCMPNNDLIGGKCVFKDTNAELMSVTLVKTDSNNSQDLDESRLQFYASTNNLPQPFSTGKGNMISFIIRNESGSDVSYIRSVILTYNTMLDSTLRTVELFSDIFLDGMAPYNSTGSKIDQLWIIKRLNIKLIKEYTMQGQNLTFMFLDTSGNNYSSTLLLENTYTNIRNLHFDIS